MFPGDKEFFQDIVTRFRDGTCWTLRAINISMEKEKFCPEELYLKYNAIEKLRDVDIDLIVELEKCFYRSLQDFGFLLKVQSQDVSFKRPFLKQCIVAFYYSIYQAATAIGIAYDRSNPQNHAGTAKKLLMIANGDFPTPFSTVVSDISPAGIRKFGSENQCRGSSDTKCPQSYEDAVKWVNSSLRGTAEKKYEAILKKNKTKFQVDDLRRRKEEQVKKALSQITLDTSKQRVGIIHTIIRMREKAQYTDAVYLGYGLISDSFSNLASEAIDDMVEITNKFFTLAFSYSKARTNESLLSQEALKKSVFDVDSRIIDLIDE